VSRLFAKATENAIYVVYVLPFMTRQMFSLLHLTNSLGFTSLITTILLHYCFISILF